MPKTFSKEVYLRVERDDASIALSLLGVPPGPALVSRILWMESHIPNLRELIEQGKRAEQDEQLPTGIPITLDAEQQALYDAAQVKLQAAQKNLAPHDPESF